MTFATPWAAVLAAAIAIPILLVLYFLKLRRRPRRVASTMLWDKSIEDLQVNVPFQRLRLSALFLLQLLTLILLILALGQPSIRGEGGRTGRLILLIDRSASMRASAGGELTRLDLAKEAAREIIERAGRTAAAREIMIIAFARHAVVMSSFETDRRVLREAIEAIEPTDEPADLAAALKLADAFSATIEDEQMTMPGVALISDGSIGAPESASTGFTVRAAEFSYVAVGSSSPAAVENIGIVAISARRDYEEPTHVNLFARLINSTAEPFDTALTARADGDILATRRVEIPPATGDEPGFEIQTWKVELPRGGILTVSQGRADALATDDVASLVVPPPIAPRIAIVTPEDGVDPFVRGLAEATEPAALEIMSLREYENLDPGGEARLSGPRPGGPRPGGPRRAAFDFFIFDRVVADPMPEQPWLVFGALPGELSEIPESNPGGHRFTSWNRRHALMRHVELDQVIFADFGGMAIPEELEDRATTLATGPDGPVIVELGERTGPHVIVGFDLIRSNWPADVSLLVFMQNVLDAAALGRGADDGVAYQPGETIMVTPQPAADVIEITGPGDLSRTVPVEGRERITLPIVRRVGLYRVAGAEPPHDRLALNLMSEQESDLRPRENVIVNAEEVEAAVVDAAAGRELWPWLLAAAFLLLIIEWLIYASRARV